MSRFNRILAVHQLVGGVVGLVFGALYFSNLGSLFGTFFLLVGVASCVAGILAWKESNHASTVSVAVQALQVPAVVLPSISYKLGLGVVLITGPQFAVTGAGGIKLGLPTDFRIVGAVFESALGGSPDVTMVGANLVALIFLVLIIRNRRPAGIPAMV